MPIVFNSGLSSTRRKEHRVGIRKIVTVVEETLEEGGRAVEPPVRTAAAMAVISNPFAGRPFQQDLKPLINEYSRSLGEMLSSRAIAALGPGARVEAYGKGALVGLDGEIEHGSAIIHTLTFGNPFRSAVGPHALTLLPSAEKRASAGASMDIAMKHVEDAKIRSHHMTFEVRIPDAPRPDEIVVVCAVCDGGRPHPRIGDLAAEMERK
jgi:hypothetical protein